jgi:protein-tyrosine phosphatase
LAEGILASKLPKDKFTVDSAGTGSWHIDILLMHVRLLLQKKNKIAFQIKRTTIQQN